MELGTLLVKLSANTTGFSSQMSAGAKSLEDFAKGAKKISGDLGQVGLAVTAFGGAMTALAATVDGRAEKSLTNLKNASALLGVQIYDIVAPAIHDMTEGLKRMADMVAALSPSVKASASHFAEWAVGIGVAGMALQKVFTVGETLFSIFKTGFAMLSAPILAFVAALAGIVAVILVIVDNWNTFKEMFGGVVDYAKGIWRDMVFVMSAAWEGFIDVMAKGLEAMGLDSLAGKLRAALSPDALGASIKGIGQSIASAVSDGLSTAFKSAQSGAKKLGESLGINEQLDKLKKFAEGSTGKARHGSKDAYDYSSTLADEMARDEKFRQQDLRAMSEQSVDYSSALEPAMARDEQFRQADYSTENNSPNVAVGIISAVTSKMGELGSVISSIAQGAQTGGIWGAIIAAIMEVVGRMKGFTDMADNIMSVIYDIADAFGPVLEPIFEFISQTFSVITDLLNDFKPVLEAIGSIIKVLIAPMKILTSIVGQTLNPLFTVLGKVIGVLLWPLQKLAEFFEWLGAEVDGSAEQARMSAKIRAYGGQSEEDKMKGDQSDAAAIGLSLEQTRALKEQMSATVNAADKTLNFSLALDAATHATQTEAKEFLDRWKATYGSATAEELAKKLGLGDEDTKFAVAQYNAMAAAAGEGADKLNDLNEQLSDAMQNVPKGVKLALARFNSQDGVIPGSTAQEAPYSIGPVYVNAASGKQLWDELVGVAAGEANLKTGGSGSVLRALKGF